MISWIFFWILLALTVVGMIQRNTTFICAGVLGAFGALILAAYSPNPW